MLYNNVIHLDDVGHNIFEMVKKNDGDVVAEGIFILRNTRKRIIEAYTGNGKRICIWLNESPEECERRENRHRAKYIVWNCYSVFEPPTYDEGWDEIWIIENKEKHLMKKEGD